MTSRVQTLQQIDPTALIDAPHLVVSITGTAVRRGSALVAPDRLIDDSERRRLLADLLRKSRRLLTKLNAPPLHPHEHIRRSASVNECGRQRVAIGLPNRLVAVLTIYASVMAIRIASINHAPPIPKKKAPLSV